MKAERMCREEGIQYQIVPVPKEISSECGMALEIDADDEPRIASRCDRAELEVAFYRKEKGFQ